MVFSTKPIKPEPSSGGFKEAKSISPVFHRLIRRQGRSIPGFGEGGQPRSGRCVGHLNQMSPHPRVRPWTVHGNPVAVVLTSGAGESADSIIAGIVEVVRVLLRVFVRIAPDNHWE